jgi:hypothetical protein
MTSIESSSPYELNSFAQVDAAITLRRALSALSSQVSNKRTDLESVAEASRSNDYLTHRVVDLQAESKSNLSSPHNCFELYAYGYELADKLHDVPHNIEQEVICCVTLYNLGLTFHLLAVEKNISKYFEKALKSYSLSYENFQEMQLHLSESMDTMSNTSEITHEVKGHFMGDISLFLLTLLNNIAHIQSHCFDNLGLQQCISELKYVLVRVTQSGLSHEKTALFDSIFVRVGCEAHFQQAAAA